VKRGASGLTVIELLVVFALAALTMLIALNAFSGWSDREEMRSGIYTIQTYLHVAQSEAAARNRACRFLVDTAARQIRVVDLVDPANTTDDIVVASTSLSGVVSFEDPSGGAAVTLELQSGTTYGTTFASDGSVSAGAGLVAIRGGNRFCRITVFGAGATKVERWDGSAWYSGS
jgi:Tfp pilus assembly protein FimT